MNYPVNLFDLEAVEQCLGPAAVTVSRDGRAGEVHPRPVCCHRYQGNSQGAAAGYSGVKLIKFGWLVGYDDDVKSIKTVYKHTCTHDLW